jgi:hypothetical protein
MDEIGKELLDRTSKKTKKQLIAEYTGEIDRTRALTALGMPSQLRKASHAPT